MAASSAGEPPSRKALAKEEAPAGPRERREPPRAAFPLLHQLASPAGALALDVIDAGGSLIACLRRRVTAKRCT